MATGTASLGLSPFDHGSPATYPTLRRRALHQPELCPFETAARARCLGFRPRRPRPPWLEDYCSQMPNRNQGSQALLALGNGAARDVRRRAPAGSRRGALRGTHGLRRARAASRRCARHVPVLGLVAGIRPFGAERSSTPAKTAPTTARYARSPAGWIDTASLTSGARTHRSRRIGIRSAAASHVLDRQQRRINRQQHRMCSIGSSVASIGSSLGVR